MSDIPKPKGIPQEPKGIPQDLFSLKSLIDSESNAANTTDQGVENQEKRPNVKKAIEDFTSQLNNLKASVSASNKDVEFEIWLKAYCVAIRGYTGKIASSSLTSECSRIADVAVEKYRNWK